MKRFLAPMFILVSILFIMEWERWGGCPCRQNSDSGEKFCGEGH